MSGQEAALFVLPSCSINTVFSFSRAGLSGNFCNTKKNEFYRFSLTTKRSSLRFIKCQVSNSAWKSWLEGCSFEAVSQCAKHSSAGGFQCPCLKLQLMVATEVLQEANSACTRALQCGKESQLHKSSTTCHLLSFSSAATFLAGFPRQQCTRIVHTVALTGVFSPCRPLFCTPFWHPDSPCEGRHWTSVTHLSELLRAPAKFSLGQTGKIKSSFICQLTYRGCPGGVSFVWSKTWKIVLCLAAEGVAG